MKALLLVAAAFAAAVVADAARDEVSPFALAHTPSLSRATRRRNGKKGDKLPFRGR